MCVKETWYQWDRHHCPPESGPYMTNNHNAFRCGLTLHHDYNDRCPCMCNIWDRLVLIISTLAITLQWLWLFNTIACSGCEECVLYMGKVYNIFSSFSVCVYCVCYPKYSRHNTAVLLVIMVHALQVGTPVHRIARYTSRWVCHSEFICYLKAIHLLSSVKGYAWIIFVISPSTLWHVVSFIVQKPQSITSEKHSCRKRVFTIVWYNEV